MSEAETGGTSERRRPLWYVGLVGLLTSVTLGWLMLLLALEVDNARLDAGHAFEDDRAVRPAALFTLEWSENSARLYGLLLLVGLGYAIPLVLLIARIEDSEEQSAIDWYLAGAVAAIPLAVAWLLLATLMPPHPIPWTEQLIPPLVLALLGMAGGAAARLVRRSRS